MYKAVVFSRVSTKEQTLDAQTEDVMKYAKNWYQEDEILPIEYPESGSSLADDDRKGLIDLTKAIDEHDIECVFIAELSRLSRRPQTLYKWKNDFIKKKINLRIKDKNLSLLNEFGKVEEAVDIAFGIYCGFTESENRNRVERCIRGRRKKAKENKNVHTGGRIPFGYQYDKKTKILDFHPEQKKIVEEIFELYRTGKYGVEKIYSILKNEKGYIVQPTMIGKILRNADYTGEPRKHKEWKILVNQDGKALKEGNNIIKIDSDKLIKITKKEILILNNDKEAIKVIKINEKDEITEKIETRFEKSFERIIHPSVFEECRIVAEKNNTNLTKSKSLYFAHRLIRCSECNGYLKALKPKMLYRCQHSYNVIEEKNCMGKDSININAIDALLWILAKDIEITFRYEFNIDQIAEWEKEIAKLQSIIDKSEIKYKNEYQKNVEYYKKVEYMDPKDIEKYAKRRTADYKNQLELENEKYKVEIIRLYRQIADTTAFPISISTKDDILFPIYEANKNFPVGRIIFKETMENDNYPKVTMSEADKMKIIKAAVEDTSEQQRYDIIHKHIKEVRVFNEPKGVKRIEIQFYDSSETKTFYYAGMKKDKSKRLYCLIDNEPQYIEYENRFER